MNIKVSGETERAIREQMAAGQFESAEEVVAALVRFWKEKGDATPAQEVAQGRRRPSPILEEEEIVAPYDLPRNFVGQITVRKGQPHTPDPIVLE